MNIHNNYPQNNRVNFTAMKKSQFSGIDFSVVEKFKAPIEKFNTMEDFENWAGGQYKELVSKDFGGRDDIVANQRYRMKKEWNYFLSDGGKYSPAERLLILNGITKGLDPKNNNYMPAYNETILNKTMNGLFENLSEDKKYKYDFGKIYTNNLKDFYAKDISENYTGWTIIPSRTNDRENFDSNVKKLQSISGSHWCTKSTHAKPYLTMGDFHIYFEKGDPKIALRFDEDVAVEFQGVSNNDRLVPEYFNVLEKYVEENDISLADKAKREFDLSKENRDLVKDIEEKIGDAVKTKDYAKILNYINIETKKDKNGKLILSHYKIPKGFDFKNIGIDENDVLKSVSRIEGDADFTRSKIDGFGSVEYIGGRANFAGLTLENLGGIKEIGGDADLNYTKLNSLGKLVKVGKNLNLDFASIKDLYPLKSVGGKISDNCAEVPIAQLKSIQQNIY